MPKPLVTDKGLAEEIGEKVRTINSWRRDGIIPCILIGHRTIRYDVAAVIAALKRREVAEAGRRRSRKGRGE